MRFQFHDAPGDSNKLFAAIMQCISMILGASRAVEHYTVNDCLSE